MSVCIWDMVVSNSNDDGNGAFEDDPLDGLAFQSVPSAASVAEHSLEDEPVNLSTRMLNTVETKDIGATGRMTIRIWRRCLS